MTWTIETIGKFFESKMSNPTEFYRLTHEDPTARLWAAMRKAEQTYLAAKHERQSLGVSGISIDEARTVELETAMQTALETRRRTMAGLEAACSALGGQQEPTVQALKSHATYLRRTRQGGDAASLDALCTTLEGIAQDAGV